MDCLDGVGTEGETSALAATFAGERWAGKLAAISKLAGGVASSQTEFDIESLQTSDNADESNAPCEVVVQFRTLIRQRIVDS